MRSLKQMIAWARSAKMYLPTVLFWFWKQPCWAQWPQLPIFQHGLFMQQRKWWSEQKQKYRTNHLSIHTEMVQLRCSELRHLHTMFSSSTGSFFCSFTCTVLALKCCRTQSVDACWGLGVQFLHSLHECKGIAMLRVSLIYQKGTLQHQSCSEISRGPFILQPFWSTVWWWKSASMALGTDLNAKHGLYGHIIFSPHTRKARMKSFMIPIENSQNACLQYGKL